MYKLEKEANVRVGFGLFLCATGLAAVALLLFIWSFTLEGQSDSYYAWVEPAYALGMLSLPLFLLGIVVLLPTDRRLLGGAVGGVLVTVVATLGFLWAYPADWYHHGGDYTLQVVLVYAIGIAGIAVGTGASMKEHAPELIRTVTQINLPEEKSVADGGAEEDGKSDVDGEPAQAADGESADDSESGSRSKPAVVVRSQSEEVESAADAESGGASTADGHSQVTLIVNGTSYTFGDGDTFGRQDEPWLQDLVDASGGKEDIPYVSNDHLAFSVEDDGIYVTDQSRNGTALNGRNIDGETAKLSDGDTLVLADRAEIDVEL